MLDYGAGNVRSLRLNWNFFLVSRLFLNGSACRNALKHLGYVVKDITSPADIETASVILFPGQGCFHQAIHVSVINMFLSFGSIEYVDSAEFGKSGLCSTST